MNNKLNTLPKNYINDEEQENLPNETMEEFSG
jgi:hypothetical protein